MNNNARPRTRADSASHNSGAVLDGESAGRCPDCGGTLYVAPESSRHLEVRRCLSSYCEFMRFVRGPGGNTRDKQMPGKMLAERAGG